MYVKKITLDFCIAIKGNITGLYSKICGCYKSKHDAIRKISYTFHQYIICKYIFLCELGTFFLDQWLFPGNMSLTITHFSANKGPDTTTDDGHKYFHQLIVIQISTSRYELT
jgi:uncharacterized membrane protein YoaT (DUF817 family)